MKNESFSSDDFFKQNEGVIARALTKDSVDITDLDFSKLQNMTIFTLLSLVSPQATEAVKFADATKALVMELSLRNLFLQITGIYAPNAGNFLDIQ